MSNLTTVAAVKHYANVSGVGDDSAIGGIITGVSEFIAGRVGHDYDKSTRLETYPGAISGTIILRRPASKIRSVLEGTTALTEGTDFALDDPRRLVRLAGDIPISWLRGGRSVTVEYVPVSVVPADLELAAREMSAFMLKQSALEGGGSRLGLSAQANPDTGSADYFAQTLESLPMTQATLKRYRRLF